MPNFMRLALGTLTRIPVRAPDNVNSHVATFAMSFAPVIGLVLALIVGIPMVVLTRLIDTASNPLTALLIAVLAIGALAWLTRAIHLDGLADTADALGSGKPAAQALEIARKSDIGPFGVITLVLALLGQVLALGVALAAGHGFLALVLAVFGGRVVIAIACLRGIPSARREGLGALVAGSVPATAAIMWSVALIVVAAGLAILEGTSSIGPVVAAVLGIAAALVMLWITRHRLGGITGDVIGAVVEVTTTAILVVLALAI